MHFSLLHKDQAVHAGGICFGCNCMRCSAKLGNGKFIQMNVVILSRSNRTACCQGQTGPDRCCFQFHNHRGLKNYFVTVLNSY